LLCTCFYDFVNTVFELIIVAFIIARLSAAPCIFQNIKE